MVLVHVSQRASPAQSLYKLALPSSQCISLLRIAKAHIWDSLLLLQARYLRAVELPSPEQKALDGICCVTKNIPRIFEIEANMSYLRSLGEDAAASKEEMQILQVFHRTSGYPNLSPSRSRMLLLQFVSGDAVYFNPEIDTIYFPYEVLSELEWKYPLSLIDHKEHIQHLAIHVGIWEDHPIWGFNTLRLYPNLKIVEYVMEEGDDFYELMKNVKTAHEKFREVTRNGNYEEFCNNHELNYDDTLKWRNFIAPELRFSISRHPASLEPFSVEGEGDDWIRLFPQEYKVIFLFYYCNVPDS